jgi:hypothetical protein
MVRDSHTNVQRRRAHDKAAVAITTTRASLIFKLIIPEIKACYLTRSDYYLLLKPEISFFGGVFQ